MNRIVIIGCGGAGKSTLARALGERTGMAVFHLDREHWLPGWRQPDPEEWSLKFAALQAGQRWIMEGYHGEEALGAADTIVFLDYARSLCLYRAARRSLVYRNRTRPDLAPGYGESFDEGFFKSVWQYRATRRPGVIANLRRAKAAGKRVIVLRNPRATTRFLERTRAAADASSAKR